MPQDAVFVTLPMPVPYNGGELRQIELTRMPTGLDLGQHSTLDLLNGEAKALARVINRIGTPTLPPKVIQAMPTANLLALQTGIGFFFEDLDLDGVVSATPTQSKPPATATKTRPPS